MGALVRGQDAASGASLPVGASNGALHVSVGAAPGTLETRLFTIQAATDCATTRTAPIAAELYLANGFAAGKKRARVTWHTEITVGAAATDVPHAAAVFLTLNASDDPTALGRLSYVASTVGSSNALATDAGYRVVSESNPVIEWDLSGTDSTVDDIYAVGHLPTGTGVIDVHVLIEVW